MYDSLPENFQLSVAGKENGVLPYWNMEGANDKPQITQRNARYISACFVLQFGVSVESIKIKTFHPNKNFSFWLHQMVLLFNLLCELRSAALDNRALILKFAFV